MNWLDIVLLLLIAGSVITSFRKGLVRELIALVSAVLALILGIWFYGIPASWFAPYLSSRGLASFAGFFVVFCGILASGAVVSFVAGRFLKVTGLSVVDHLLGAAFGLVRGALIATALVMGILAFSQNDRPSEGVIGSRLAPYAATAARLFAAMAPHELKQGFQKAYAQVKSAWERALQNGKNNERKI